MTSKSQLKVLGTEATVTTANAFGGKQVIRVYNQNAADVLLTIANGGGTTGTITVKAGETIFIQKTPAETIAAATGCKMVAVAY